MERILGADAGAKTNPAELRQEIPPNIACKTEVMEGDSGMRHGRLSYSPFSEIQRMRYILRTGIRMYIIGVS